MLNQFFLFNIDISRFLIASLVAVLLVGGIGWFWPPFLWLFVLVGPVVLIGVIDLAFSKNTIIRNFPFL